MNASSASASASARAHGGRGVDDTADAATAARWLEGAFMSLVERERGHCWNGFGFGLLDFGFFPTTEATAQWRDGWIERDGWETDNRGLCVCFVFVAESKTLVKQHAFHMKRATVSNLKTTARLDTR